MVNNGYESLVYPSNLQDLVLSASTGLALDLEMGVTSEVHYQVISKITNLLS